MFQFFFQHFFGTEEYGPYRNGSEAQSLGNLIERVAFDFIHIEDEAVLVGQRVNDVQQFLGSERIVVASVGQKVDSLIAIQGKRIKSSTGIADSSCPNLP